MRSGNKDKTKKEFEELLLEVRRVTRVTTGGRKLSFRATVVVGNKKGKIGIGVSKGLDVSSAVSKASREAFKNMFIVPITENKSVPYQLSTKYKACFVKLLPAMPGTGLKAGSSVRAVMELAGYENILSKIIGSNNKLNNALTTLKALSSYKHADFFNKAIAEPVEADEEEEDETDLKVGEVKVEKGKIVEKKESKKAESEAKE
ncbi:MAG: 30S ribosomal protein S5 [bacterium]